MSAQSSTITQEALAHLKYADGGATRDTIADALNIAPDRASDILRALRHRGLA